MKKLIALMMGLGLAASLGAARVKALDILNDEGFKSDNYNKLTLASVSAEAFLKSIKDIKNYDAVSDQITDINLMMKTYMADYAKNKFEPGKGSKELKMTVTLTDYNAGSRAAAAFVGFGAGNGHCKYEIHLWEGQKDVASFESTVRIQRMTDISGDASRARIPKAVVSALEKFLSTH
jgi:hypothetical protein